MSSVLLFNKDGFLVKFVYIMYIYRSSLYSRILMNTLYAQILMLLYIYIA